MDWTLFWTAFSAIGTTTAALVTAVAVVIAVKQYKQPLKKNLRFSFGTSFFVMHDNTIGESAYHITVANCGIRPVNISGIYCGFSGKKIVVNFKMYATFLNIRVPQFPFQLLQEQSETFYMPLSLLSADIKQVLEQQHISAHEKMHIVVTDQTAGEHCFKTDLTATEIASNPS